MGASIWEIIKLSAAAFWQVLFDRWFKRDEKPQAFRAKELEAENLAKPTRSWSDTVDGL